MKGNIAEINNVCRGKDKRLHNSNMIIAQFICEKKHFKEIIHCLSGFLVWKSFTDNRPNWIAFVWIQDMFILRAKTGKEKLL